jgi:hypothetical protein
VNDNGTDDRLQGGLPADDAGNVETAGETTAAATAGGKSDERPVGADTLVKTQGEPDTEGKASE